MTYQEAVVVPGMSLPQKGELDAGTKPFVLAIMYQPQACGRSCPKIVE